VTTREVEVGGKAEMTDMRTPDSVLVDYITFYGSAHSEFYSPARSIPPPAPPASMPSHRDPPSVFSLRRHDGEFLITPLRAGGKQITDPNHEAGKDGFAMQLFMLFQFCL